MKLLIYITRMYNTIVYKSWPVPGKNFNINETKSIY